jgi:hypothetical protein
MLVKIRLAVQQHTEIFNTWEQIITQNNDDDENNNNNNNNNVIQK